MTPGAVIGRLMQGTARQPLTPAGDLAAGVAPDDPAATLKLLALAAQAQRFRLPAPPARYEDVAMPTDNRPIVPDAARPLMVRLVSGKGNLPDDSAALALAAALDRLKLRPHPFDLPRLVPFVRKHSERLGAAAAAFVANEGTSSTASHWFDADLVDADNWKLATPARKAAFIASLRNSDPASARTMVEVQLPLEKADVRVRLVDALATGLGPDDRGLLEALAGDRAPNVKQAAARLLTRLPGTDAAGAQLEELRSRITVGTAGLLRKRAVLKLQLPANLRAHVAITPWLAANFGAVGSDQLAAAFGLTPESMLEAAQDDDSLLTGIAFAACAARDWPLLRRVADDHAQAIWTDFVQAGLDRFGITTPQERAAWADAVLPGQAETASAWSLVALQSLLEGPLSLAAARAFFAGALHAPGNGPDLLTVATSLMPIEGMGEARRALAGQSPELAGRAALLADLILLLSQGPNAA